jgi:hypothetical protein
MIAIQFDDFLITDHTGTTISIPRIVDWLREDLAPSQQDPLIRKIELPGGNMLTITLTPTDIARLRSARGDRVYTTQFMNMEGPADALQLAGPNGAAIDTRGWYIRVTAGISG